MTPIACATVLGLTGCPDDSAADGTGMGSGFASDTEAPPPASTSTTDGPADTTTTTASTTEPEETGEPWAGTAFVGDLRAVLTVTFTPEHPLSDGNVLGLAGGYRTEEVGWDGLEDLWSPVAYQLALPPLPDDPDTLLPAEPVPVFDWGDDEDWRQAGQAMKLRQGEEGPQLTACLLPTGAYPLYRSSTASSVSTQCHPDPAAWMPAAEYDVVLYGGELFADNVLEQQRITTPEALAVTAPDLATFDAPLPVDQDLAITWEAGTDPEARIIIRVIDADTNVISVHAADDGEFTIPAAELAALTPGPIDLVIARERTDRVQFTMGGLTVLSRHERWGFFDLY